MEYFFICPHCGQRISMVIDPSVAHQTYVEDCEVCCKPIEISYVAEDGAVTSFAANAIE